MAFRRYILLLLVVILVPTYSADEHRRVARKRQVQPLDSGFYPDFRMEEMSSLEGGDPNSGGDGSGDEEGKCNTRLSSGSPKQKATSIAQKAATDAMAASDAQNAAGQYASQQVKAQLADKAMQAAKAAEAALAGKQQIVAQMEDEVREAEAVVQEQTQSLANSETNVKVATLAAQQAKVQLNTLTNAVKMAASNLGNAEHAANGATQELAEKTQLLDAAKTRVEGLLNQLCAARADFANTKKSAMKAAGAAHEAKSNAQRNRRQQVNAARANHYKRATMVHMPIQTYNYGVPAHTDTKSNYGVPAHTDTKSN